MPIVIEVDEAAIEKLFDKLTGKFKNFEYAWPEVVREFFKIEEEQFDSLGHGKWQPLSPAYAKWKAAHHPGRPLMVLEGRVRDAFTGGASVNKQPLKMQITVNGANYWKFHQRGTRVLPIRKIVDLTPENKRRIAQVFIDEVRKTLK